MNVADLREILQYVPRFRERIFVIAVDGNIAASENFANILLDLAVLRSLSIQVVLVHGASHQIQQLASTRNITPTNTDGINITDEATLELSVDAAIGLTNEIMQGLSTVDLRAAYLNAVVAHPSGILNGVDQLFSGRVEKIDTKALKLLLQEGIIPVIPPIGFDGEGDTYRVNSDDIAVQVAEALRAAKIIFLSAHDDELPKQFSTQDAENFSKKNADQLPAGLLSKIKAAAHACRSGVSRVHLLNGHINEALLTEIFSNEGCGSMVYSNEYQQIRKALKKDVRHILTLIQQSVKNEELIRRTRAEILQHLDDYWVLEVDRNVVACVALHIYDPENTGELACLYVSNNHENQGYGRKLMSFIERHARARGLDYLFALSTRAFNYLQQKGGYQLADASSLPPERLQRYNENGRNSRILRKPLKKAEA
ncbi:MAG: amino-acid N-acetyltransferase [Chthoniobacterales bacterium]